MEPKERVAILIFYNHPMKTTRRRFLSLLSIAALHARFASAAELSKFRLGVTTDEIDDDLLVAIRFLRRFGLKYAEIRNIWGKYNTELPLEKIREARRLLDENGIQTAILDTSFFKIVLPEDNREGQKSIDQQWALLDRAFERAHLFGTDRIRMFAFEYPRGGEPDPKNYPRIIELLREAVRRAKSQNMRLALENVGRSYVSTAKEAAKILAAIEDEALGLTWDPNNSAASGGLRPYPEGYRLLDPSRIYHVHLRDYRHLPSGRTEWCGVGEGEFDHVGQLRALLEFGYQETLSLETHFRIDGSKAKASEFSVKALLNKIQEV